MANKKGERPRTARRRKSANKEHKLTTKERVFIDAYLRCFDGAKAAREAHYSERSIYSIAYENLRKPEIREEIELRLAEIHMSSNEVLARLADHARGSHRPFVKIGKDGSIYFDFSNPEALEHLHLIKKIETKRTRRVDGRGKNAEEWEDEWTRVELHDPQKALELLGKHAGIFQDLNFNIDMSKLTDSQLQRIRSGENPLKVLTDAT